MANKKNSLKDIRSVSKGQMPVRIYTSAAEINNPMSLFVDIANGFRQGNYLGWRLFIRNVNVMYRQSILGFLWAFIPPLLTALIWVFLQGQRVFNVSETPIPYPAFVLTGTILWQIFLDSLNIPIRVINQSKSMLAKINFPRESLILASLYEILFNVGIKLILLVGVFIWFGVSGYISILLGLLGILVLVIIGSSISLLLSPLAILYGDVQRALLIFTQFLFFLTPIIYPQPKLGIARTISVYNPLAQVITSTRNWLTINYLEITDGFYFILIGFIALFLIGIILFRIAMPHLIERIGS